MLYQRCDPEPGSGLVLFRRGQRREPDACSDAVFLNSSVAIDLIVLGLLRIDVTVTARDLVFLLGVSKIDSARKRGLAFP